MAVRKKRVNSKLPLKRRRFFCWSAIAFGVAASYTVAHFVSARPFSHAARWWAHSPTLGLHHHSAMAIAVGLFAATFSNVFRTGKQRRPLYRSCALALLAILLVAVVALVTLDSQGRGLRPPYLTNDDARKAVYEFERKVRGRTDLTIPLADNFKFQSGITAGEYRRLVGRSGKKLSKWYDGNLAARVAIGVDYLFGTFIAVYLWY